jgi:hypothetical protein
MASAFLRAQVAEEVKWELVLTNQIRIRCFPCTARAPRGRTIVTAIMDEVAFFQIEGRDAFFAGRRLAGIGGAEATAYVARRQAQGAGQREHQSRARRAGPDDAPGLRAGPAAPPAGDPQNSRKPPPGKASSTASSSRRYAVASRPMPQAAASIAYLFGWRMQSEVLTLERRHLDVRGGTLRRPGHDQERRRAPLLPPPGSQDVARGPGRAGRPSLRKLGRIIPWLFPPEGPAPGATAAGVRLRVAASLPGGRRAQDAPPRSSPDRGAQPSQRRGVGARGHEDQRPQDARRVRPLPTSRARQTLLTQRAESTGTFWAQ